MIDYESLDFEEFITKMKESKHDNPYPPNALDSAIFKVFSDHGHSGWVPQKERVKIRTILLGTGAIEEDQGMYFIDEG